MLGGSVTRLFRSSHLPPAEKCECSVRRSWLAATDNFVRQVSYIQYLLACKKSPRSTPHNIVKSALLWSRIFRRRHLGRRVTALTCLRWPTVRVVWWVARVGAYEKLTHWGRVTYTCVSKLTIIGSDNGLSPERRQTSILTNAGILLIGHLGTNFNDILTGIQTFSFKKNVVFEMASILSRPQCVKRPSGRAST